MPNGLQSILDTGASLGTILLGVFYIAIVLWTYKDARRRIEDPILIATAVACSMLPIVGVLVYMMLRPPEYLADVRERELEIRAMERELGRAERCPYCRSHIEGDYRSCPVCMTKLRESCNGCAKPLDPRWAMCPYCETEVPRAGGNGGGNGGRGGRGNKPAAPRRSEPVARAPKAEPTTRPRSSSADRAPSSKDAAAKPRREAAPAPKAPETKPVEPTPAPTTDPLQTEPFQLSPQTQRFVRSTSVDQPTMAGTTPTPTEH